MSGVSAFSLPMLGEHKSSDTGVGDRVSGAETDVKTET